MTLVTPFRRGGFSYIFFLTISLALLISRTYSPMQKLPTDRRHLHHLYRSLNHAPKLLTKNGSGNNFLEKSDSRRDNFWGIWWRWWRRRGCSCVRDTDPLYGRPRATITLIKKKKTTETSFLYYNYYYHTTICNWISVCFVEGCKFPTRWEGVWFQSGIRQSIVVQANRFSIKGKCVDSDGDRFLLSDE